MTISTIIPVFNAAPFVEKAVLSALQQPEVAEVVLLEDASTDDSLRLCKALATQYPKVKLFQHADKKNHGAGASRNLGIEKSTSPYLAFLDADDYYLENRFGKTCEVLQQNPEADGVYEAITRIFSEEKVKAQYYEVYEDHESITMEENIAPEQLFEHFFIGDKGWFSLDGLLIKRQILERSGIFDVELRQTQDTDFILRLCLYGKLFPGELKKPVTVACIHGGNRILDKTESTRYRHLLFKKWFTLMLNADWSKAVNRHIIKGLLYTHPKIFKHRNRPILRISLKVFYLAIFIIKHPKILRKF